MAEDEFEKYKQERLREIAFVIRESEKRMRTNQFDSISESNKFEELQDRIEKLKNVHPWLR